MPRILISNMNRIYLRYANNILDTNKEAESDTSFRVLRGIAYKNYAYDLIKGKNEIADLEIALYKEDSVYKDKEFNIKNEVVSFINLYADGTFRHW